MKIFKWKLRMLHTKSHLIFICVIYFEKKIDGNSWEKQHGKKAFKEISIPINSKMMFKHAGS